MTVSVAQVLAEFALAEPVGAEEATAVMRLSCLDWAACAIAGSQEPVAQAVRAVILDEAGRGAATLVGGGRAPARAAALANGAAGHALDYDDTHFDHIGHPTAAIMPAALAIAESQGRPMPSLISAALIGAEASVRFGIWLGRGHYQAGFHQTATAGAIGATLAACRLLGLSRNATMQALGLVSTRASGLKSQFGTMGKPYNAGLAASNGVEAALLAAQGFLSDPAALDGAQGFGPTHAGAGDLGGFDGLGRVWRMTAVSHKYHACCHGLHAMLEALAQIEVPPDRVRSVTVRAHSRWDRVCNIARPRTGLEAKFSFRLAAAMALAGVPTAAMASFSAETAADCALAALRDRVEVVFDDGLAETAAAVTVRTDGDSVRAAHDLARPLPLAERAGRIEEKARALLGGAHAARLQAALKQNDLSGFLAALA